MSKSLFTTSDVFLCEPAQGELMLLNLQIQSLHSHKAVLLHMQEI